MPASFRKQKLHIELYTLNAAGQNRRYAVMLSDSFGSFSAAGDQVLSVCFGEFIAKPEELEFFPE